MASISFLDRGERVNEKTLEPLGFIYGLLDAVIGCLLTLLLLWGMEWAVLALGGPEPGSIKMTLVWGVACFLNNSTFSKFPYTGKWVTMSETLGITMAIAIFFKSLPLEQTLITLIFLGCASHFGGLLRVKRLKRMGYTEAR